jgi:hypothetical protein
MSANFAQATLSAGLAAGATSLTVAVPSAPFQVPSAGPGRLTLLDQATAPTVMEIVTYTGRTDNGNGTFTYTGLTRGAESTTGRTWSSGAAVLQSLTAGQYLADLNARLPTAGGTVTGVTNFTNTTGATSATTGAVVVTGGVGVGGSIFAGGNITAYSDIRLKTDIELIAGALDKVCALHGVTYERVDTRERQTGLLAQEVQAVLPEAVVQGEEYLGVAYGNMVGLLVEAIKELRAELKQLEGQVIELEESA